MTNNNTSTEIKKEPGNDTVIDMDKIEQEQAKAAKNLSEEDGSPKRAPDTQLYLLALKETLVIRLQVPIQRKGMRMVMIMMIMVMAIMKLEMIMKLHIYLHYHHLQCQV